MYVCRSVYILIQDISSKYMEPIRLRGDEERGCFMPHPLSDTCGLYGVESILVLMTLFLALNFQRKAMIAYVEVPSYTEKSNSKVSSIYMYCYGNVATNFISSGHFIILLSSCGLFFASFTSISPVHLTICTSGANSNLFESSFYL